MTAVLLGPSLPNGYLLTNSLQKAVQSRRVRGEGEQAQFLGTRSRVVMQGFRSCFSCFSCTRTPFFAQTTHRVFTWTTDSASPIYQFSAGTHSHATQANRPAFNFSLRYRPSLAIETLVKAISEVEGVFCNQLQKLILQALTMVLCILLSAIGRCSNHRCGGQKPALWWRLK